MDKPIIKKSKDRKDKKKEITIHEIEQSPPDRDTLDAPTSSNRPKSLVLKDKGKSKQKKSTRSAYADDHRKSADSEADEDRDVTGHGKLKSSNPHSEHPEGSKSISQETRRQTVLTREAEKTTSDPKLSKAVSKPAIVVVNPEADTVVGEALEEYWSLAWNICSERFHERNAPIVVSLELRDTWLRIMEVEWLDLDLVTSQFLYPSRLFSPDEPPLPLAYDSWSRGTLELLPRERRESVLDPFIRDKSSIIASQEISQAAFSATFGTKGSIGRGDAPDTDSPKTDTSSSGAAGDTTVSKKNEEVASKIPKLQANYKSPKSKDKVTEKPSKPKPAKVIIAKQQPAVRKKSSVTKTSYEFSYSDHDILTRPDKPDITSVDVLKKIDTADSKTLESDVDQDGTITNIGIESTTAFKTTEAEELEEETEEILPPREEDYFPESTPTALSDQTQTMSLTFPDEFIYSNPKDENLPPRVPSDSLTIKMNESFQEILEARIFNSKSSMDISKKYKRLGLKPWSPSDCGGRVGSGVFRLKNETTTEVIRRTNPSYVPKKRLQKKAKPVFGRMKSDFHLIFGEDEPSNDEVKSINQSARKKTANARFVDNEDIYQDETIERKGMAVDNLHLNEINDFKNFLAATVQQDFEKQQEIQPVPSNPSSNEFNEEIDFPSSKSIPLRPDQLTKSEKIFFDRKIEAYRVKYHRQLQLKSNEVGRPKKGATRLENPSAGLSSEDKIHQAQLAAKGINFPEFISDTEVSKRKKTLVRHSLFASHRGETKVKGEEKESHGFDSHKNSNGTDVK